MILFHKGRGLWERRLGAAQRRADERESQTYEIGRACVDLEREILVRVSDFDRDGINTVEMKKWMSVRMRYYCSSRGKTEESGEGPGTGDTVM